MHPSDETVSLSHRLQGVQARSQEAEINRKSPVSGGSSLHPLQTQQSIVKPRGTAFCGAFTGTGFALRIHNVEPSLVLCNRLENDLRGS